MKTTKTATPSKTTIAKFWIARAKKIATARARNVKSGVSERERRATVKAAKVAAALKAAKKAAKKAA